jgi:uncharacterized membrane protein
MDRLLVVVFDNEIKALQGRKALLELDSNGSISIYAYAVVAKRADGTATAKLGDDFRQFGISSGTSLESLVGRLGGPTDLTGGPAAGAGAGATTDRNNAGIGEDFIADVSEVLLPNRVAVVAEIAEEWTTLVDARMEPIGGIVFRWTLSDVGRTVDDEDVATRKAEDPSQNDLPSNVLLGE